MKNETAIDVLKKPLFWKYILIMMGILIVLALFVR